MLSEKNMPGKQHPGPVPCFVKTKLVRGRTHAGRALSEELLERVGFLIREAGADVVGKLLGNLHHHGLERPALWREADDARAGIVGTNLLHNVALLLEAVRHDARRRLRAADFLRNRREALTFLGKEHHEDVAAARRQLIEPFGLHALKEIPASFFMNAGGKGKNGSLMHF